MKRNLKNIVSLSNLNEVVLSISLYVRENIIPSSMPLGRDLYFRSIQPFNFYSDYIEINQLKGALLHSNIITSTELLLNTLIKSMYRVLLLM